MFCSPHGRNASKTRFSSSPKVPIYSQGCVRGCGCRLIQHYAASDRYQEKGTRLLTPLTSELAVLRGWSKLCLEKISTNPGLIYKELQDKVTDLKCHEKKMAKLCRCM